MTTCGVDRGRRHAAASEDVDSPSPPARAFRRRGEGETVESESSGSDEPRRVGWVWRALARRLKEAMIEAPPRRQIDDAPPAHGISPELMDFLRRLGVAVCQSGQDTAAVERRLDEVAAAYDAPQVRFLVLPTGVFVRIGDGEQVLVDFATVDNQTLDLDQIEALDRLMRRVCADPLPPKQAIAQLNALLTAPPRFGPAVTMLGQITVTVGLGLLTQPTWPAVPGYAVLGAAVGLLYLLANRFSVLSLALPVAAAILVTVVAMSVGPELTGVSSAKLIIPPLVTFLPGAALTIGTIDLTTGSLIAGASRLVYGFNVLFLLAFGIYVGVQVTAQAADTPQTAPSIGWWAPAAGIALLGLGFFLRFSAPSASLPWVVAVLAAVWLAQFLGSVAAGVLFGAFLGGAVIVPAAQFVQSRRSGPAAQVVFLPAFWLLVPGAVGLSGLSRLVTQQDSGLHDLLTALLTVAGIALGVLVGSSAAQTAPRRLADVAQWPSRLRRKTRKEGVK